MRTQIELYSRSAFNEWPQTTDPPRCLSGGPGSTTQRSGLVAVTGAPNKNLVLAAMVFAVAMTFIDQTIVAIAIPSLQKDLSLSSTGSQWIINGYLLALSALFAFGGKLGDVLGRRRMRSSGSTFRWRSSP